MGADTSKFLPNVSTLSWELLFLRLKRMYLCSSRGGHDDVEDCVYANTRLCTYIARNC